MSENQNQINQIQNEVLELKSSVEYNKLLVERLDRAIEKISEVSGNISKLLAVHETRLEGQDENIGVVHKRISELREEIRHSMERNHDTICEEFEEVKDMFEKQESRISTLEQWKYAVVIASVIIGFLLSKIEFSKIF